MVATLENNRPVGAEYVDYVLKVTYPQSYRSIKGQRLPTTFYLCLYTHHESIDWISRQDGKINTDVICLNMEIYIQFTEEVGACAVKKEVDLRWSLGVLHRRGHGNQRNCE